jgi:serine/threonine-protein kinase
MASKFDRLEAALADRYQIERELGQGGMATVYLAEDLKHERQVAIKVLKPELAAVIGADRFLTEIKTTANLQHPHILPLFDSGEAGGFLFYVMPYVDGESLKQRLTREKQLSIDETVRVAAEVGDALNYAHRRGIIHRDVKPENVLLQDGRVLVADFGIALAVHAGGGARLTETGLSLGTPAYMSPEQAAGDREVDGRTDVYSLGCLIYEMLSGEPPHSGSTAQAVLASVLTQRPRPVVELRETVPDWLAALTHRALARLPADRFSTAGALRDRLLDPGKVARDVVHGAAGPRAPRSWHLPAALGVAGLVAGLILGALFSGGRSMEPRPTYIPVSLPDGVGLRTEFFTALNRSVTISPDGRTVVFVGERGGQRLYRLSLDAPGGIEPIPGTEGARSPFYSSTGVWIGFVSGSSLMKVPAGGGTATELAAVSGFRGGAWGPDDEFIYYVPVLFGGVWRMAADGGEPQELTRPAHDGIDAAHMWPTILPNGDLLFTSCCGDVRTFVLEGADPERTPRSLIPGGDAQYVPSGHLVFMQRANTMIAAYDLEAREVGPPEPVLDAVITGHEMFAEMAVSASGTVAYLAGRSEFERPLVRIYPDGSVNSIPIPPASHAFPIRFSLDGRSLLYASYEESQDIFSYDLVGGRQPRRLTTHPSNDYSPIWGPGPSRITFTSIRDGGRDLYTLEVDSGTGPQPLFGNDLSKWPQSWTADGAWLLFHVTDPDTGEDLWLYSAEADSAWAFLDEPYNENQGAFAPSGDWLAYARDDFGQRPEIWAMAFPDAVPCPVSSGGGNFPVWSRDGARLYYLKGDTLMLAEAEGGSVCDVRPRPYVTGMNTVWGLPPDESYVVTVSPPPPPELRLVIDWATELEGRARD